MSPKNTASSNAGTVERSRSKSSQSQDQWLSASRLRKNTSKKVQFYFLKCMIKKNFHKKLYNFHLWVKTHIFNKM